MDLGTCRLQMCSILCAHQLQHSYAHSSYEIVFVGFFYINYNPLTMLRKKAIGVDFKRGDEGNIFRKESLILAIGMNRQ